MVNPLAIPAYNAPSPVVSPKNCPEFPEIAITLILPIVLILPAIFASPSTNKLPVTFAYPMIFAPVPVTVTTLLPPTCIDTSPFAVAILTLLLPFANVP